MPPSRFNRTAWPESGPHRELLEFLDGVHRRFGCRSLREVGRAMHLSYSRVHDIVRGVSLPVSEEQVRSLALALVGENGGEADVLARQAAELFVKARRSRDESEGVAVLVPEPTPEPEQVRPQRDEAGQDEAGRDEASPGVDAPSESAEVAAAAGEDARVPAAAGEDVGVAAVAGEGAGVPAAGGDAGVAGTPAPGRRRGSGWRRPRRVVAAALSLVAVVAVAVTVTCLVANPSEADVRLGGVVLQDPFGTSALDPGKWRPATRADLIYPADGRLNFVIGPTDSAQGAEARLEPRSLDGYRSLSFVAGNPRVTKQGPGGVYLTLRESDGRNHRLFFGPGSEGPEVAALMCTRPECHTYDDYDPPGVYVRFRPGEEIPVRIVQRDDGTVQIYARDRLIGQGPLGDAPLETFTWDLYGAKSEAWHITASSLLVSN